MLLKKYVPPAKIVLLTLFLSKFNLPPVVLQLSPLLLAKRSRIVPCMLTNIPSSICMKGDLLTPEQCWDRSDLTGPGDQPT